MKIKKIASLTLAAILAISAFTGCGDTSDDSSKKNDVESHQIEGVLGDTMKTYFFDFTVNSAYTCASYEGYSPAEGNKLLVADLTIKNTFNKGIEMYDTDFIVMWDSGDDAYNMPVSVNLPSDQTLGNNMLPAVYQLSIKESRQGILVYEVPSTYKDFSLAYLTVFDDDSTGDVFFVDFTPEQK